MRSFVSLRSIAMISFFLSAYAMLGANLTFGQKSSRRDLPRASCEAGDVSFLCPEDSQAAPVEAEPNLALFFQKKYSLGLFVVVPASGFDERKLMTDVVKTSLAKFFPKESQSYSWKPMNYTDSVSKYEVGGGMAKGFNGSLAVVVKYRHIKVNGKELFVGYVADFSRGSKAKDFFEKDEYGDTMAGCNTAVEVIYSVTGEKMDEENPPCTIVLPSPAG